MEDLRVYQAAMQSGGSNMSVVDKDTMESFSLRLHVNTAASVLANLFAFYLIVYHSSKSIAAYKWCLFNVSVSIIVYSNVHIQQICLANFYAVRPAHDARLPTTSHVPDAGGMHCWSG